MNSLAWDVRPDAGEYHEYYGMYTQQVPDGDVLDTLARELEDTLALLRSLTDERARHRYAPDKWSIKEVVGHVVDTERIFATRALACARSDPEAYPSFEQEGYVASADLDARPVASLAGEFEHLRRANLLLFRSWSAEHAMRRGVASGREFTARSIPFILAGHEIHHKRVVRERYLQAPRG